MMDDYLDWATSKTVGSVTEIAVLAPIRKGRVPGERRTYEERLRAAIENLQGRTVRGLPNELNKVATIHFGRVTILRPEQFLVYSDAPACVDYYDPPDAHGRKIPKPIDDFVEDGAPGPKAASFRSMLLTQVTFDRDLRVYFRDIAEFVGQQFDKLFQNTEDFPDVSDFEAFWRWIRRYQINTDLFVPAYSNLSVPRIKYLEEFKRRFDRFVDQVRSPTGRKVDGIDDLFDQFLRDTQQIAHDFPGPGGVYRTDGDDR